MTKRFQARHLIFRTVDYFTDHDAPDWLTSTKTVPGSTMDDRWFWNDHVLTLGIRESVQTDFHEITRLE